ncbi:hypothetical protein P280DRAFT_545988 [Massarina eburnea CBS 473.64]|uniref:Calcineurin-like phosphoesterase domain-containing protein n=1 Tax=Massarina eburnea CBS 473.64 TaxID=1395130 RepID=A0A6A6S9I7_9PLEO|nr:hypothetical protein P280DRAFT_545988 [Massarina eburnea CBS 473.64]
MQLSRFFFAIAVLLAPVALLGTSWLYLYPFFDDACAFPTPPPDSPGITAPFRLLALGDPQLEGDTSLPKPGAPIFPSLVPVYDETLAAVQAENYSGAWDIFRDRFREGEGVKGWGKRLSLEGVKYVWKKRKWIDLWGNDWYLAHIVRTLRWWTEPSHVAVLGDLLGSQWIQDEEFERRQTRYWRRVFGGMVGVPEYIMTGKEEADATLTNAEAAMVEGEAQEAEDGEEKGEEERKWGGTREVLGADTRWKDRVINIAGNHDIGYAGDIDAKRIERFERAFGKVNWDIVFTLPNATNATTDDPPQPQPPELRLVILNSMNLDTPCWAPHLQQESYDFMNHVVATSRPVTDKTHATILLTHIPFHKESGICVDSPLFTFFEGGSGVREQNMLSDYTSQMMLEGIFGLSGSKDAEGNGFGRHGIVINGHDHAGCDVLHWTEQPSVGSTCPEDIRLEFENVELPEYSANASDASTPNPSTNGAEVTDPPPPSDSETEDPKFQAIRWPHPPYTTSNTSARSCVSLNHVPRVREITLRSMMGDYAGYAGFLSAWFDPSLGEKGEWKLEFSTCGIGTQHWWWAYHIVDLILVVAVLGWGVASVVEKRMVSNRNVDSRLQNGSVRTHHEEKIKPEKDVGVKKEIRT